MFLYLMELLRIFENSLILKDWLSRWSSITQYNLLLDTTPLSLKENSIISPGFNFITSEKIVFGEVTTPRSIYSLSASLSIEYVLSDDIIDFKFDENIKLSFDTL